MARVQLEALHKTLQAYRMDVGRYPGDAQGLWALVQPPADVDRARWRGPYYPDAPALDPWGSPYLYHFQGAVGRGFEVYSLGRARTPGGSAACCLELQWVARPIGPWAVHFSWAGWRFTG